MRCALLTLVVVLFAQCATAQAGFAPTNDVVVSEEQYGATLASDASGNSIIVWSHQVMPSFLWESRARLLSAGGELGPVFELAPGEPAFNPAVAMSASGRAFVAWRSFTGSGPSTLRGRWVEPDGTLGPILTVITPEPGIEPVEPSVVIDPGGVATVGWRNESPSSLSLRRVHPDGSMSALVPDLAPMSGVTEPRFAALPNGSTLAVWANTGIDRNVVDTDLSFGTPEAISSSTNVAWPEIALDSVGNSLVIWREATEDPFSVRGRLLGPTGVPLGEELIIDPNLPGTVGVHPSAAADSAGDFIATWDRDSAEGDRIAYARGLNVSGAFAGPAQQISAGGADAHSEQSALQDSGTGEIAWSSHAGPVRTNLGRTIDAAGAPNGAITELVGSAGEDVDVASAPVQGFAAFLFDYPDGAVVRRYLESPTCGDSQATVKQGKPIIVPLSCTGLEIEGAQVLVKPAHGSLGPIGVGSLTFRYTPKPGYKGTDSFSYSASNDGGASGAARVTIKVGKDTVKPRIKRFRFVRARPRDKFVVKLSEPARVGITVDAIVRGAQQSKRVVVGRVKSRKPSRRVIIRVRGKLAGKLHSGGRFRATAIATDPARNRSRAKRLKIKVKRQS